MKTPTPLQSKTPFDIDPEPMEGQFTSLAGLAAVSRVFRALNIAGMCEANVSIKQRDRGYTIGQQVESIVLLHAAGGDCMEDMQILREDTGLPRMLGYTVPSPRTVCDFLQNFHDKDLIEQARQQVEAQGKLAFIPEETSCLEGLQRVLQGSVGAINRIKKAGTFKATIDMDATIIEAQKRSAYRAYEGTKGYQPMVAIWAEEDLILADEFRDGNVPAIMEPLNCAQVAFAALPRELKEFYFRGDSACYEWDLIKWLRDENRVDGPKGKIGFAVSARMSTELAAAVRAVPETEWKTIKQEADGTLRQWAEVDYTPSEASEKKDTKPLRYIGLRLLCAQMQLFDDGSDRRHFAILTNLDWAGDRVIDWQREKAGTIEHVHDELKNGLGGGRLPSNNFGANAAWFRMACLAYNVMSLLRYCWPDSSLREAKAKSLRFHIFRVPGRFVRNRRKITLKLAISAERIRNLLEFFKRIFVVTRSTA